MKSFLPLIFLLFHVSFHAQQWKWAFPVYSRQHPSVINIDTDSTGKAYLSGMHSASSVTFHANNGNLAANRLNSFVVRYDRSGNILNYGGMWNKFAADTNSFAIAATTDKFGNTYLTGTFANSCYLGTGNDTLARDPASGTWSNFTGKIGPDGKAKWLSDLADSCGSEGVIINGKDGARLMQLGNYNIGCTGGNNPPNHYIGNVNALNGALSWSLDADYYMTMNFQMTQQCFSADNSYLVQGYFLNGMTFPGSTLSLQAFPNKTGLSDSYLVKYSLQGQPIWSKAVTGSKDSWGSGVTTDPSSNIFFSVYGDGILYYDNTSLLPITGRTNYLIKTSPNGSYIKHLRFAVDNNHFAIHDMKGDASGNLYITARTDTTLIIGNDTLYKYAPSSAAEIIIKFDNNLNYQWSEYMSACCAVHARLALHDSIIYVAATYDGSISLHGSAISAIAPYYPWSRAILVAALTNNDSGPVTGIEVSEKNDLQLYPNPSSGIFYLSAKPEGSLGNIRLYDIAGHLVFSQADNPEVQRLDFSWLSPGLYFINFDQCSSCKTEKLLITNGLD